MASDNGINKDHLSNPDPQTSHEHKGYDMGLKRLFEKPPCAFNVRSGSDSMDSTRAQTEICVTDEAYANPSGQNKHSNEDNDAELTDSLRLPAATNLGMIAANDGQGPVTPGNSNATIAPPPLPSTLRTLSYTSLSQPHSPLFRDKSNHMEASARTPTDNGSVIATVSDLTLDASTSLPGEWPNYGSTLAGPGRDETPLSLDVEAANISGRCYCSDEQGACGDARLAELPLDPSEIVTETVQSQNLPNLYNDYGADTDSALGDVSCASSMTSVTSSIYESVLENGRTYHSYKPGKYVLPNDLKEQGRLDTQHYMLCEAIGGKLFRAPLQPHRTNRVLDIATGTGIWAMEFADDFPHAEVIGTDLTPIQPRWCPPNCRFEVDDAEDEWVYTSPFSYIHGRILMTCFKDPRDVIFKCFQNLEQGGWLEFQDGQVPFEYEGPNAPPMVVPFSQDEPTSVMQKWEKLTLEASIKGGRPWNNVKNYKRWFEEAGLVDVTEHRTRLPLGTWDGLTRREKRIGAMQFANMYHGLEGMTLRNLARLDWTFEESKALIEDVRKEMLSRKYRPCTFSIVVMGRKPYLDLPTE